MNSITRVLLLAVLGCVCAQQTDLKQQVLAAMDSRGISKTLREMDEECRSITRELLGSCIAELYFDFTLEQIQSLLFATNLFGDFALNLRGFAQGLDDVVIDANITLKRNGCCRLLCQIAKHGCSCGTSNVNGLRRAFVEEGLLLEAPLEFLNDAKRVCEHENIVFEYNVRFEAWRGCHAGANEIIFARTTCT
eukprot:g2762.t1